MTKKHFIALAKIISAEPNAVARKRLCEAAGHLFASDNARFDWTKWRKACEQKDVGKDSYNQLRENGWSHDEATEHVKNMKARP